MTPGTHRPVPHPVAEASSAAHRGRPGAWRLRARHGLLAAALAWLPLLGPTSAQAATAKAAPAVPAAASAAAKPEVSSIQTGVWVHALSSYQAPKYAADFSHFEYVNPDAPKGGLLRMSNPDRRSSFDKYNPYTLT